MIRVKKIATKKIEICWDTGMEFQFIKRLNELIEHRNEIIRKCNK